MGISFPMWSGGKQASKQAYERERASERGHRIGSERESSQDLGHGIGVFSGLVGWVSSKSESGYGIDRREFFFLGLFGCLSLLLFKARLGRWKVGERESSSPSPVLSCLLGETVEIPP